MFASIRYQWRSKTYISVGKSRETEIVQAQMWFAWSEVDMTHVLQLSVCVVTIAALKIV